MRLPDAPLWCRGCLGSSRRWHLAAPRLHNALSPHLHTCTPPHFQAREVQAMVVLQRKRQLRRDALQVWEGGGGARSQVWELQVWEGSRGGGARCACSGVNWGPEGEMRAGGRGEERVREMCQ